MRTRLSIAGLVVAALLLATPVRAEDPDLIVDTVALETSWFLEKPFFPPDHCAVLEGCAGAGYRKILRFTTDTANIAPIDLYVGPPENNPLFEFSRCHGHHHFSEFADYTLLDEEGNAVAPGHKQAFCLQDTRRYLNDPWVPPTRRFDCEDQGIQRGWVDSYPSSLDCQWIDVTGVKNGQYTLSVTVNPDESLRESDYTNNTSTTLVTISDVPGIPHRPDGVWVEGKVLRAEPASGSAIRIRHDVTFCPAFNYNVYYGLGNAPSSYTYDGARCLVGTSGDVTVSMPEPQAGELLWFTIVGRTLDDEGGHGFDSDGNERPLTGVGFCTMVRSLPSLTCQ